MPLMDWIVWTQELRLLVALALGLLVGLERERSRQDSLHSAGVRTHALASLLGFGSAFLGREGLTQAPLLTLGSVTVLGAISYWTKSKEGKGGWTSELAILLTTLSGILCLQADIWIPMALSILGTIILSEKKAINQHVGLLSPNEFLGVLKFLLVTLIVLPVLPNRSFTTYELNPASTWKIVVMVSTVGFVGYFLVKKLGGRTGLWVSGLVGGIVSSTAVSVATGRIAQRSPEKAGAALQATLLASSVMYLRILALVWMISPLYGSALAWKLPFLAAVGVLLAVTARAAATRNESMDSLQNPFEIVPALVFAGFFALFSVASSLVRTFFGVSGLLVLALVVGAVDIDPFILSVSHAATLDPLLVSAILLAMLSNTIAKGVYFGSLAAPVRRQAFLRYGLWALLHLPLALL
ncbi:MAG: MgtC/SapB family protein [Fibrobacteria bacterium]|nr:MgtC/SapB family protein [Fibrobacteria bacterium]